MSQLHTRDGCPIGFGEFIKSEGELVGSWSLVKETPSDDLENLISAWVHLFAKHVGDMCKELDVPVDVVLETIAEFQERIRGDLELCKWAQSNVERRDVGFDGVLKLIESTLSEVRDDAGKLIGYSLVISFPYVDLELGKQNSHPPIERQALFPLAYSDVA